MSGQSRRVTLMKAAAVHAAGAVARLANLPEPKLVPEHEDVPTDRLVDALFHGDPGLLVAAELSGAVTGWAGIGLPGEATAALLRHLLGRETGAELDRQARSALSEAGNIAISAAAGALGHLAGGVVVPSVPKLSNALPRARHPGHGERAYLMHLEVGEGDDRVQIQFFWIPPAAS